MFESQPTNISNTDTKPWVSRRDVDYNKRRVAKIIAAYAMDMLSEQSVQDSRILGIEYAQVRVSRVT